MGYRCRSSRSSGLRLLLRLASLVAALAVLCVSSRASAAASPLVPMCGERNESIAAPPIFRAYQPGSMIQAPCQPEELRLGRSAPLAPERIVVQERPERALGFSVLCVLQSESSRLSIAAASSEPERPGIVESLDRPPRA